MRDAVLDSLSLERLVARSMRVKKGERIFLSGNAYGLGLLEPLLRALRAAGARVTVSLFSDETLVHALLTSSPSAAATLWMPRRVEGKTFEVTGRGPLKFDKFITLFSSVTERPFAALAEERGAEGPAIVKRAEAFERAASANHHGAEEAGIPYVLLDLPARPVVKELRLDFDSVLEVYHEAMTVDPRRVRERNRAVERFFQGKERVRVTCPRGTDISFLVGDAPWRFEDLDSSSGSLTQIPGGEAFLPPVSKSAEGVVVTRPTGFEKKVVFRKGKAVEIFDRKGEKWVRGTHPMVNGKEPFCEFGVGTNPAAPPIATGPIYEKALGTVHFGVGGNAFFGGPIRRPRHRDFIVENPRVEADGVLFSEGGRWAIGR